MSSLIATFSCSFAVVGGVAPREAPFERIVCEAAEEAGLPEEFVRKGLRAGGTVTWFNISDEKAGGELGLMYPGVLYVYGLEVGEYLVLKPVDNNIHAFYLMDTQEVMNAMARLECKPASACVMLDFLSDRASSPPRMGKTMRNWCQGSTGSYHFSLGRAD